jgi:dihydropyrimidinase
MTDLDLVVSNGTIVTAEAVYRADVGIVGTRIVAISQDLRGRRRLDASGCYVLPGAVDVHVHLQMPVGGYLSSDDFASGTVAAAHGGTTTVIDFVEPKPGQSLMDALAARRSQADGRVAIDYGLHMTIPAWHADQDSALAEIPEVMKAGVPTFKLYLAYEGLRLDDAQLYTVLKTLSTHSALAIAHCENGPLCDRLRAEALAQGQTAPRFHALTRPPRQEAEATGRCLDIASLAGAPLYVVHVSCAESLQRVVSARQRGQRAYGETCPQYLTLTAERLGDPDGARFVCAPPPRTEADQAALWGALARGELQVIATDHCPFTLADKAEAKDFTQIPGGLPGIEPRLSLVHTLGVLGERLSLSQWVNACCTAPANLFGLQGKGRIAPGFDADLVVFDPERQLTLTAAGLHERVDRTPYEGLALRGWPRYTASRGQVVAGEGEFVGEAGNGRFVPRYLSAGSPVVQPKHPTGARQSVEYG